MISDHLSLRREEAETHAFDRHPTDAVADRSDQSETVQSGPAPAKTGDLKIMRILIVEDDVKSAEHLIKSLREHGHTVEWAPNGEEGLHKIRDTAYDVLIVDRVMPVMDGVAFVRQARAEGVTAPAIFVTAHDEVDQRVEGLKAGADDYLAKPVSSVELLARIDAINRRSNPIQAATRLEVGDLVMDLLARKVRRGDQEILLQPREFRLLEYLMKHAEQVVTRTMLLENVWEYHFDPQTNVIDVHISRLRSKIDKSFDWPMLHTVRGAGYSLRASG